MKVIISSDATSDLAQIVDYYNDVGNRLAGRKIRANVINSIMQLKTFPNLGKPDNFFSKKYDKDCRVLVSSNYKIIYYVDNDKIVVVVLNVLDTRQNPDKL